MVRKHCDCWNSKLLRECSPTHAAQVLEERLEERLEGETCHCDLACQLTCQEQVIIPQKTESRDSHQASPPSGEAPRAEQHTAPQNTPSQSTLPQSTPPQNASPKHIPPQSTPPQSTLPQSTLPQQTPPKHTPPQSSPPSPPALSPPLPMEQAPPLASPLPTGLPCCLRRLLPSSTYLLAGLASRVPLACTERCVYTTAQDNSSYCFSPPPSSSCHAHPGPAFRMEQVSGPSSRWCSPLLPPPFPRPLPAHQPDASDHCCPVKQVTTLL